MTLDNAKDSQSYDWVSMTLICVKKTWGGCAPNPTKKRKQNTKKSQSPRNCGLFWGQKLNQEGEGSRWGQSGGKMMRTFRRKNQKKKKNRFE